jgi:2-polyprenyl-3-methyl-5-hydroxy-6-metoxy-1,4-benzoquinol methylase
VTETAQRAFWNEWNHAHREAARSRISDEQAAVVVRWLDAIGRRDLDVIEIGCGAGWFCETLARYGRVVGTDLADEVLARAAQRTPQVEFVAGDFMQLDFGRERFDVAITLETLAHVADQQAFLNKAAALLKPGGLLMLATQNAPALRRNNLDPPAPGQIRRWVDRDELRQLLETDFDVEALFSITPVFHRGPLHVVNSERLRRALGAVGLGFILDAATCAQERAGLGWTLMALARKRP